MSGDQIVKGALWLIFIDIASSVLLGWEKSVESEKVGELGRHRRESLVIQSLLLSKRGFKSATQAKTWVEGRGFKTDKIDSSGQYFKFRQQLPGGFRNESFRTFKLTESGNILARGGRLKTTGLSGLSGYGGLYGIVRNCLEWRTNAQGRKVCKRWTKGYKCMRVEPALPVCDSPEACIGKVHRYSHPSVPEGTKNEFKATYKLVEADSLITSHDPTRNFIKDPRYPEGVQDRDYQNPRGQDQIAVIRNAGLLDPDRVINLSLTSAEGPPVATMDNVVLSGNSRAMAIRLASKLHHNRYEQYKKKLFKEAATYGFTQADIELFKNPVLVREVELAADEIFEFASFANKPVSRTLDPVGKSIELAKLIPDSAILQMELEEGETLRAFLDSSRGKMFIDLLVRNTAPTERAQLFSEEGALTDAGKSIIEDALFAKIFDRRELIANMSGQLKRALEFSLPDLIRAKAAADNRLILMNWDIVEALRKAVDFSNRNLKGVSLQNFLKQLQFVAVEKVDFDSLWGQAISLLAQWGNKPKVLRRKLIRFVNEAEFESAPKLPGIKVPKRTPSGVLREIVESAKEEEGEAALFGFGFRSKHMRSRKNILTNYHGGESWR